jgi:hypothetical protein
VKRQEETEYNRTGLDGWQRRGCRARKLKPSFTTLCRQGKSVSIDFAESNVDSGPVLAHFLYACLIREGDGVAESTLLGVKSLVQCYKKSIFPE